MPRRNRPGRPAGPSEGRGSKYYDPSRPTPLRDRIIFALIKTQPLLDTGELTLGELARMVGTCQSYLSYVKNSEWGQRRRAYLSLNHHPNPGEYQ